MRCLGPSPLTQETAYYNSQNARPATSHPPAYLLGRPVKLKMRRLLGDLESGAGGLVNPGESQVPETNTFEGQGHIACGLGLRKGLVGHGHVAMASSKFWGTQWPAKMCQIFLHEHVVWGLRGCSEGRVCKVGGWEATRTNELCEHRQIYLMWSRLLVICAGTRDSTRKVHP